MDNVSPFWYIVFFSLVGGLFSLVGGVLLLGKQQTARVLAVYATPFAAGALLAAVFLDLLPEGIEVAEPSGVLMAAMSGIVIFFFAERFLHWFHHHHQHEHADPSTSLIITGDIVHNALDGVAIAAAFLISIPTGIVTTLVVAAHEIPQEIGDFGLLLSKGMSRRRVLLVNVLSALATTVAAIVTYLVGDSEALPLGVLFGLSAGFLLYIALSDIIPEIHESASKKRIFDVQPILLLLGVIMVSCMIMLTHGLIADHHTAADVSDTTPVQSHDDSHQHADNHTVCIQIYPPPAGCE